MTDTSTPPRTAIVTGGARGLGRVMALALRRAGYAVTITASGPSAQLDATIADSAALPGGEGMLLPVVADVSDPEESTRVIAETINKFGALHALINNAGRGMRVVSETFNTEPVRFWDIPGEKWDQIFATNVNGPFYMTQAAMPHFFRQGEGRIINVSTSAQTMVRTGYAPYGGSKAALEAMTRSWAADLTGTGITANLLLPGGASDTDLLPASPTKQGADGNLLDPEIMAAPAVWLCSPESAHVSGARFIARYWNAAAPVEDAIAAASSAHVVGV